MVILNPDFIVNHSIEEVIAKNFQKCRVKVKDHLLAAIEFKFIVSPLSANMQAEIIKDFYKLSMAIKQGQTKRAYLIVFNRYRPEENFIKEFKALSKFDNQVQGIYIESIKGSLRHYKVIYLNHWISKLRFETQ